MLFLGTAEYGLNIHLFLLRFAEDEQTLWNKGSQLLIYTQLAGVHWQVQSDRIFELNSK